MKMKAYLDCSRHVPTSVKHTRCVRDSRPVDKDLTVHYFFASSLLAFFACTGLVASATTLKAIYLVFVLLRLEPIFQTVSLFIHSIVNAIRDLIFQIHTQAINRYTFSTNFYTLWSKHI